MVLTQTSKVPGIFNHHLELENEPQKPVFPYCLYSSYFKYLSANCVESTGNLTQHPGLLYKDVGSYWKGTP